MSFLTRVQNTFTYGIMLAMRDFWLMPIWEEMVDEYFPKDSRPHRPSLLELEREAGLALQFGNPLIADGMRPVSPNYVMIGMMNCRKANPLPDWLNNFMEGLRQKNDKRVCVLFLINFDFTFFYFQMLKMGSFLCHLGLQLKVLKCLKS